MRKENIDTQRVYFINFTFEDYQKICGPGTRPEWALLTAPRYPWVPPTAAAWYSDTPYDIPIMNNSFFSFFWFCSWFSVWVSDPSDSRAKENPPNWDSWQRRYSALLMFYFLVTKIDFILTSYNHSTESLLGIKHTVGIVWGWNQIQAVCWCLDGISSDIKNI